MPLSGRFVQLLVLGSRRTPLVIAALPLIQEVERANLAIRFDERLAAALGLRFQ
jgi:hypothetical protein